MAGIAGTSGRPEGTNGAVMAEAVETAGSIVASLRYPGQVVNRLRMANLTESTISNRVNKTIDVVREYDIAAVNCLADHRQVRCPVRIVAIAATMGATVFGDVAAHVEERYTYNRCIIMAGCAKIVVVRKSQSRIGTEATG